MHLFQALYLSGQWKIIDKFSAKFSLDEKCYYQMNISQRVGAVNKFNYFVIPKTKAGNKQCTSRAPFVPAQLKLTDIPQSIIHEIYNEAKGIVENGSVLKGFWNIFFTYKTQPTKSNPFRLL